VILTVFLPLAVLFAFLGSIMAFLITYSEHRRHYTETRKAVRSALRTGATTFLFFCALSLIAGIVLDRLLSAR
jgi:cation transporter-like permease